MKNFLKIFLILLYVTLFVKSASAEISDATHLNMLCRGRASGIVIESYANGTTKTRVACHNGTADGIGRTFYQSGVMKSKITFKKGIVAGTVKEFYPEGNLKTVTNYDLTQRPQTIKKYARDGRMTSDYEVPIVPSVTTIQKTPTHTLQQTIKQNSSATTASEFAFTFLFLVAVMVSIVIICFACVKNGNETHSDAPKYYPFPPVDPNDDKESPRKPTTPPDFTPSISPTPKGNISEIAQNITGYYPRATKKDRLFGTKIHKELSQFYKTGDSGFLVHPVSKKLAAMLPIQPGIKTEFKVPGGRCDIVIIKGNKCTYLSDFKTSNNISGEYLEYCKCQLNLYRDALYNMGYDVSDIVMEIIYQSGKIKVATKNYKKTASVREPEYINELSYCYGCEDFFKRCGLIYSDAV